MKIINFDYKYDSSVADRIKLIQGVGFDGVFIYSRYTSDKVIEKILNSGLAIETLHLPYKKYSSSGELINSRYVNSIWVDGSEANEYVAELLAEVELAHRFGIKTVVMHISSGDNPPPQNRKGLYRIEKIASSCEKHGVVLCLENLRRLDYLEYVFEEINDYDLKFCFDSGHANYMTQNISRFPWHLFGPRLYCLHLNDNNGLKDQHLPPLMGSIDWGALMKTLVCYNANMNMTLEVRATEELRSRLREVEFLKLSMEKLTAVDEMRGL